MSQRSNSAALWIVLLLLHASLTVFLIADRRLERESATKEAFHQTAAALSGSSPAAPGLSANALLLILRPFGGSDPQVLFHLGLFLDELIFLLGVWLLVRSLFADPRTAFFVSVAALGSSVWVSEAALNVRLFCTLPLLLHLSRSYLRSGSPLLLFAALNLAALQALGSPPGLFFLTPLAAVLILAGSAWMWKEAAAPPPRWSRNHSLALLAGSAAWIPVGILLLSLPGQTPPSSPGINVSMWYCGFLTLGFVPPGYARLASMKALGLVLLTVILALIPGAAPLLRLLLVFLAGAGFDALLKDRLAFRRPLACSAATLLAGVVVLAAFSSLTVDARRRELLDTLALWAAVAAGLLLLLRSRARAVPLVIALILFLHPLELFGWKFQRTWLGTHTLQAQPAGEAQPATGTFVASLIGVNALAWVGWTLLRAGRREAGSA